jgi:membrane-associated phospholipid phosphatase
MGWRVVEALKLATNRERPNEGNGRGGFWPHGTSKYELDGSFPSGHAAVSWAVARVIASLHQSFQANRSRLELTSLSWVSVQAVTAREHFPSDVLVGRTFGYLIGRYVVYHHHADSQEASAFSVSPLLQKST